jgi:hypothetical protein
MLVQWIFSKAASCGKWAMCDLFAPLTGQQIRFKTRCKSINCSGCFFKCQQGGRQKYFSVLLSFHRNIYAK